MIGHMPWLSQESPKLYWKIGKMTHLTVKNEFSKNFKSLQFLMVQGSLNPNITHTDRHTDRQTDTKVTTVGTLSGFQEFFLQPIIKERSNISSREVLWIWKQNAIWGAIVPFVFFQVNLCLSLKKWQEEDTGRNNVCVLLVRDAMSWWIQLDCCRKCECDVKYDWFKWGRNKKYTYNYWPNLKY